MTIQEKVLKIMQLALEINDTPTKQETTGDKPTVFVDFSGHVCTLSVQIHSHGWNRFNSKTLNIRAI